MQIPKWMLNQMVTIRPFLGNGAYGPIYGPEYEARCRIEVNRKKVTDREGNEVVGSARAFFPPEIDPPVESEIVWDGRKYEVIESRRQYGLRRPSHTEVILR